MHRHGLGFTAAWIISKVSPLPAIVEPWSVVLGISMTPSWACFSACIRPCARPGSIPSKR
jgi:hypothetical protein